MTAGRCRPGCASGLLAWLRQSGCWHVEALALLAGPAPIWSRSAPAPAVGRRGADRAGWCAECVSLAAAALRGRQARPWARRGAGAAGRAGRGPASWCWWPVPSSQQRAAGWLIGQGGGCFVGVRSGGNRVPKMGATGCLLPIPHSEMPPCRGPNPSPKAPACSSRRGLVLGGLCRLADRRQQRARAPLPGPDQVERVLGA